MTASVTFKCSTILSVRDAPPSHLTNRGSLSEVRRLTVCFTTGLCNILAAQSASHGGSRARRPSIHAFRSFVAYCQIAHGATCTVGFYMSRMQRIAVMIFLASGHIGDNCRLTTVKSLELGTE